MKIIQVRIEHSNPFFVEDFLPLIPTVIFWQKVLFNHRQIEIKFCFWRWWFKVRIIIMR